MFCLLRRRYYPPDFDPSQILRQKGARKEQIKARRGARERPHHARHRALTRRRPVLRAGAHDVADEHPLQHLRQLHLQGCAVAACACAARVRSAPGRPLTPFCAASSAGTKFNSRKEDAAGEEYLGIQIFRFYFKCPRCSAELAMKTDPKNSDYVVEAGATRNYEPWRDKDEQARLIALGSSCARKSAGDSAGSAACLL
jgi:hypothetical protein